MSSLNSAPNWFHLLLSFATVVPIGWLDYATGTSVSVVLLYLVPVFWAAWWTTRSEALAIAVASGVVWFDANFLAPTNDGIPGPVPIWNTIMVTGVFLLFALVANVIRNAYEVQKRLNDDLLSAQDRIQRLEQLLPVCAWCKSVRTEDNDWVSVELYLTRSGPVQITHGICPSCAAKEMMGQIEH